VADRQSGQQRTLRLEYQFDRLWAEKLAQAYECLVPDKIWLRGRAQSPGSHQDAIVCE